MAGFWARQWHEAFSHSQFILYPEDGGNRFLQSYVPDCQITKYKIPAYRGADKSLARPGRKQARKHVMDARVFNKIEMRAVFRFLFLQGEAPKEIHAILTETLPCFLPGRAKDLSAPLYNNHTVTSLLSSEYTNFVSSIERPDQSKWQSTERDLKQRGTQSREKKESWTSILIF